MGVINKVPRVTSILLSLVSHLGNFTRHSNFTGELERDNDFLFFFLFFLYLVTKIFAVPYVYNRFFFLTLQGFRPGSDAELFMSRT